MKSKRLVGHPGAGSRIAVLVMLSVGSFFGEWIEKPASAQVSQVIHSFSGPDGSEPIDTLVCNPYGTIFGTTHYGGSSNLGTVYSVAADGSGFQVLKHFSGRDGYAPVGNLVLAGDGWEWLFGTASGGSGYNPPDSYGLGIVYRLSTNSAGFEISHDFTTDDGIHPEGLTVAGRTIYGITGGGGAFGYGTIFSLDAYDRSFKVLHSFERPGSGSLIAHDGVLYGTRGNWGIYRGSIFRVNVDGSGFKTLRDFTGPDGDGPGRLVISGGYLYGTASRGGLDDGGVVFRIGFDGEGFSILKSFSSPDGGPQALTFAGNTLFGLTVANGGLLFQINTDGTSYAVLRTFFVYPEGVLPTGLMYSDRFLFGTTGAGGAQPPPNGQGTLYRFSSPPPAAEVSPSARTAEEGSTVWIHAKPKGGNTLSSQWFLNETNLVVNGTNFLLTLKALDRNQSGAYTVVVSNVFGATTSAPALLSVIPPVSRTWAAGLQLQGQSMPLLQVEYAEALHGPLRWATLASLPATGLPQWYFDVPGLGAPSRFYRACQIDASAPPSLFGVVAVPALILEGSPGTVHVIDYINEVGPTNAWVRLATTLQTNTTQYYFDVSAHGQPPRLYRVTQ